MMWKRFFILALIGLASLLLLNGQENTETQGKSFLWEIQTEHGSSYLLGSVHLLKEEHYPLKKVIEDAFAQSDVLVLEVDLAGDKLLQAGMLMLQKGMYQGEETLQDNLSEKTYQQVKEKLKTMDMDIEGFKKTKPWMVALTVLEKKLVQLGFNPTFGIDLYFLKKAEGKKEIQGLETIEFQVGLFDHFSKEEDEKFLLSTILQADQIEKEMDKMITAWSNGDADGLGKTLTENIKEYPELMAFYKKINDDRNVRMVEKIISFLETGKKYFIVAGAAHMVGKNGIVQLLKDKEYQLNQL